jgi:hypothetical protein
MVGRPLVVSRRAPAAIFGVTVLAAIVLAAVGLGTANAAFGPDVTVFAFTDVGNHGTSGGFCGYSIGTRSCNRGDTPLNWCDQASGCAPGAGTEDHPVIAQNLYRLKNGRFEQVGMSWLKHGFTSTNSTTAGCAGFGGQSCTSPPAGGNQLGVGCTDPYTSSLNSSRPLGRRSEVNGATGVFPFPYSSPGGPYTVYDQRIKVPADDMNPALNAGATYWAEGQYFASDDADVNRSLNNASYRRVTVGSSSGFPISLTGSFFEGQAAIYAWPTQDAWVAMTTVDLPGAITERFDLARRFTDLGGGMWHYEYALHNHNSDRGARTFAVTFPVTTVFTNVGFKDIDHHSGEPYSTSDWTPTLGGASITWSTTDFATDANANALRFATMFNFWFDADKPPSDEGVVTIELFKPGSPTSMEVPPNWLFADAFESGDTVLWTGGTGG